MKRAVGYYWIILDVSEEVAYWNGSEWVICGLELEGHEFFDGHLKYIDEEMIPKEKVVLRSKGDYMAAVQLIDDRIKEIDSAIPSEVSKDLRALNIDSSMMAMVYWSNGSQEIVDVAKHHSLLINNK